MNYFPSTMPEIEKAFHRKRNEVIMEGRDPYKLRCIFGRFQRKTFMEHSRQVPAYVIPGIHRREGTFYMGVEILFDDGSPWRFDFI